MNLNVNIQTTAHVSMGDNITLISLIIVWYSSSIFAITSSRKIMLVVPLPFLLCLFQFVLSTVISYGYLTATNKLRPLHNAHTKAVWLASFSYTSGFVFTNLAFSIVNASFAETIKSGEPISSVLLGYVFLKEDNLISTYLSLLVICIGVGISCAGDDSFSVLGFIYSFLSNICFSARAVLAKHICKLPINTNIINNNNSIDEINLFYHLSRIGLFFLIPLVISLEAHDILELVQISSKNHFTYLFQLLLLLLFNGVCFTCYNLMSYFVLTKTTLITHAVCNVFRRVFVIICTTLYFQIQLSTLNLFGVFTAIIGVLCFATAKNRQAYVKEQKG